MYEFHVPINLRSVIEMRVGAVRGIITFTR
jgi:hypothetical protein